MGLFIGTPRSAFRSAFQSALRAWAAPGALNSGMNVLQKLRSLHADIAEAKDGLKVVDAWALAERLLARLPADQGEVARACKERDAAGLLAILDRLEHPEPARPAVDPGAAQAFTHDDRLAAMRAFKKRLKLLRLNDESRLGGRYTSGGRTSKIDAIEPPTSHPREMWKLLAAEGKLIDTGDGFYMLPRD